MPRKPAVHFHPLETAASPLDAWRALKGRGPSALLESARRSARSGRWSLVLTSPEKVFSSRGEGSDPFTALKRLLAERRVEAPEGFPFAGGAVGFAAYEAKNLVEPSDSRPPEDLRLPWLYFLFFKEGVIFDHEAGKSYFFSPSKSASRARAVERRIRRARPAQKRAKAAPRLQAQSSVSRSGFVKMVRRTQEYIRRGDIYQANLSQRFSFPLKEPVDSVYEKLKKVNPSSFFGILDAGDFQILSGSPERLLKLDGRRLETRPIAGTRARGSDARRDRELSLELLLSEKERAEHVMLVDLERNDLGRVAEYGSVAVDELMVIEEYSHVKHIVSNVRAVLRGGLDAVDAFRAFFPGGTITGAPKIRSMEVIDELEPVARGPYTGSLGYFSFTGDMDFNIIIRSLVVKDGAAHLQVGAGIVADSDPRKEYDETLYKAEAVLAAIFGAVPARRYLERLRRS